MTYADPADEILPNATPPTREDLIVTEKDYVIGPNDVLEIRILDLFVQGQEIPLQRQVSETGFIRLPLIPELVRASGYTKELLREKIADFYDPDILIDPTISIATLVRHQNTFSIVGAIQRTGTYSILRPDMRLLEALALAGGIYQPTIRYIYVLRQQPSVRMEEAPPAPPEAVPSPPPPEEVEETEAEKRQRVLRELEKALEELAPEAPQEEPVEPGFLPLLTEMASGIAPRAESPEGMVPVPATISLLSAKMPSL
jgi:protein involved in polysaccharide export with SLBB domain